MQSHGIDGETLAESRQLMTQDESQRACEVLRRKFAVAPEDMQARAKCQRFLLQRGFSSRAIRDALKMAWDDPIDTLDENT